MALEIPEVVHRGAVSGSSSFAKSFIEKVKNSDFIYKTVKDEIPGSPIGTQIIVENNGNTSKWTKLDKYTWRHEWNNDSPYNLSEPFLISDVTQALNGKGKVKIK